MKDWEISRRIVDLGHVISTRKAGFTCQRCGRSFTDILKESARCSKT